MPLIPLPQPSNEPPYEYVALPDLPHPPQSSPLPKNTLVWVHQSRGKNKAPSKARPYKKARVIEDDTSGGTTPDRRVKIRYPLGSIYSAKRMYLTPVITSSRRVMVVNETNHYRHLCRTHTLTTDRFMEVGSDLGLCCSAVWKSLSSAEPSPDPASTAPPPPGPRVVGVDISPSSVEAASRAFPGVPFVEADALGDGGCARVREACEEHISGPPTVLAIDINGTRSLPAVVECLGRGMGGFGSGTGPRLIVVKARSLWERVTGDVGKTIESRGAKRKAADT